MRNSFGLRYSYLVLSDGWGQVVLWRLEFGVGIFHKFLLINVGGASECGRIMTGNLTRAFYDGKVA